MRDHESQQLSTAQASVRHVPSNQSFTGPTIQWASQVTLTEPPRHRATLKVHNTSLSLPSILWRQVIPRTGHNSPWWSSSLIQSIMWPSNSISNNCKHSRCKLLSARQLLCLKATVLCITTRSKATTLLISLSRTNSRQTLISPCKRKTCKWTSQVSAFILVPYSRRTQVSQPIVVPLRAQHVTIISKFTARLRLPQPHSPITRVTHNSPSWITYTTTAIKSTLVVVPLSCTTHSRIKIKHMPTRIISHSTARIMSLGDMESRVPSEALSHPRSQRRLPPSKVTKAK